MPIIEQVGAREILDSRGNPTVEVELALTDGTFARAAVPSGASTGEYEAVELRDGASRYAGKGVEKAVNAVLDEIAPAVIGMSMPTNSGWSTRRCWTSTAHRTSPSLGANAILGVSLAVAKAAAESAALPLFRYIGGPNAHILPVPMLEHPQRRRARRHRRGHPGVHDRPDRRAELQGGAALGRRGLPRAEVRAEEAGTVDGLGDEGGFAPMSRAPSAALDLILSAIEAAGYSPGSEVALALDVAATEFYNTDSGYSFEKETRDSAQMTEFYAGLLDTYPLVSIEDPLIRG